MRLGIGVVVFLFYLGYMIPVHGGVVTVTSTMALIAVIYKCVKHRRIELEFFPKTIAVALIIFFVGLLVSSFVVGDKESYAYIGTLLYWMSPLVVAYLLTCYYKKSIDYVGMAATIALLVTGMGSVYQYAFLATHRATSIYNNPNMIASVLDVTIPLCVLYFVYLVKEKNTENIKLVTTGVAVIVSVMAQILSGSRGGMLGVTIGLMLASLLYYLRQKEYKKLVVALMACACIGGVFTVINDTKMKGIHRPYDMERIYLLKSSYNMWNDHKMFGVGLEHWKIEYPKKYILPQAKEPKLDMPHNIFAYFFSTTGVVGGIGFCILMLSIFGYLYSNLEFTKGGFVAFAMMWAFLAISIHGQFDVGLRTKYVMRIFCATLGFTMAYINMRAVGQK